MRTAPGAFAALSLLLVVACGPKPPASEQLSAVSGGRPATIFRAP